MSGRYFNGERSMPTGVLALMTAVMICGLALSAQQGPDRDFRPAVESPAYGLGQGPVVCLDEAHANFHTLDDRFWAFGELVRRDGYVVRAIRTTFDERALGACRILVISNAQPGTAGWTPTRIRRRQRLRPTRSRPRIDGCRAVEACCSLRITCHLPGLQPAWRLPSA